MCPNTGSDQLSSTWSSGVYRYVVAYDQLCDL